MATLAETRLLSDLAGSIVSWLPGTNHPYGHAFTFGDAANECGLQGGWQGGSKMPALQNLLETAYENAKLRSLILAIAREGIKYRDRGKEPISREEMVRVVSTARALGLQLPELSDESLLSNLESRPLRAEDVARQPSHPVALEGVKEAYDRVKSNPDAASRGYDFQDFLKLLLGAYGLDPRGPFRVVGEEIDGSFLIDSQTYLLEARWRSKPTAKADLVVFHGKVTGKSTFTRGVFFSMGPIQPAALDEFSRGRPPGFVVISKKELERTIAGMERLDTLLRRKVREVAETGRLYVDQ